MKQIDYSFYTTQEQRNRDLLAIHPGPMTGVVKGILFSMVALGVGGIALGATSHHPGEMWGVLLVNFYLAAGITIGGPLFGALLTITNAQWGRPIKRIAESTIGFAPYLWIFLVLLFFGAGSVWEWTMDHSEIHLHGSKSIWLTQSFVFARAALWLLLLTVVAKVFVYYSLRPDIGLAQELDDQWGTNPAAKYARGFTTVTEEVERCHNANQLVAPWFAFLYAVFYAMLGYDLIMSIDPHWFSTMFGGWMLILSMYATVAFVGIAAYTLKGRLRVEGLIGTQQHHDLGKLTFGAAIFWTYLMWSQYLVIWYGNLPEETGFILLRTDGPWMPVAFAAFAMCFLIPFLVLVSKAVKLSPTFYRIIAMVSLSGIWLTLFTLVMPTVYQFAAHHDPAANTGPHVAIAGVLVTIGTIGAFLLVFYRQLRKFPIMPISDPYFTPPEKHI